VVNYQLNQEFPYQWKVKQPKWNFSGRSMDVGGENCFRHRDHGRPTTTVLAAKLGLVPYGDVDQRAKQVDILSSWGY